MSQTLASQTHRQLTRLSMALTNARRRTTSERGASLVEYSLLIALIAVVVIASVSLFGGSVNTNFSEVASEVAG